MSCNLLIIQHVESGIWYTSSGLPSDAALLQTWGNSGVCRGRTNYQFQQRGWTPEQIACWVWKGGSDCLMNLLLNPGEIMGKDGEPSFALVNIERRECERILIWKIWEALEKSGNWNGDVWIKKPVLHQAQNRFDNLWWSQGESNPCFRRERPTS